MYYEGRKKLTNQISETPVNHAKWDGRITWY